MLNINNLGNGGNTSCTGSQTISPSTSGNLVRSSTITSTTFSDYTLSWGALTNQYPYLTVGAVCPIGQDNNQTILIRKITITETAPASSVSISPTSVSKTCGTAISQTFTANGSGIPQGATVSYSWNLGSASNGWLYNNAAAPQTISTSANTLTLTAAAYGIKPNNVSVIATINSTNYSGGTSTVSLAPFSINGPAQLCTSANYSINNLGCSATVTWSTSPNGLATFSCNPCTSTTATKSVNGSGYINASVASACTASPVNISTPVSFGSVSSYYISNIYVYPNPPQIDVYTSTSGPNSVITSWSYAVDGVTSRSDIGYPPAITTINGGTSCGSHTVTLTTYNACGSNTTSSTFTRSGCFAVVLSPNPTTGFVTVTDIANSYKTVGVNGKVTVTVFDQANKPLKQFNFIHSSKYNFTVADLVAGTYVVQIKEGDVTNNLKLVKQ